uniref:Uncharacterized protein n=1 Tax=uncultured bacterium contig00019 TaxID=1181510 RepID=A0A806KE54_9BACT|nr:hypothetical protein [uncultured bacterium contig00019]
MAASHIKFTIIKAVFLYPVKKFDAAPFELTQFKKETENSYARFIFRQGKYKAGYLFYSYKEVL